MRGGLAFNAAFQGLLLGLQGTRLILSPDSLLPYLVPLHFLLVVNAIYIAVRERR